MKKLAFVVVLVAAIVGIVFGGISVASAGHLLPPTNTQGPANTPHPTCTPKPTPIDCCATVNEKVTSIQGNVSAIQSDLANVTRMETTSGNGTVFQAYKVIKAHYPSIGHVSITISCYGLDADLGDYVIVWPELSGAAYGQLPPLTGANNFDWEAHNFQFDGDGWQIWVGDDGGNTTSFRYTATVTYPGS